MCSGSTACGFTAQRTMVVKAAEGRQAAAGAVREGSWEEEALKDWENMHGWKAEHWS